MNEYGQLILCNKHNFASKSIINPIILMRKLRLQPNLSDFKGCGLSVTTYTHTHTHTHTHTNTHISFYDSQTSSQNSISTYTTGHQTKLTNGLSLQNHKNWLKQ